MGYTHYWSGIKASLLVDDAKKIIKKAQEEGIKLGNSNGVDAPVVTDDSLYLNGCADEGLDHETFYLLDSDLDFNFCKTNRKPYDDVVVAILVKAIVDGDDQVSVSSDGDYDDWHKGISLFERAVRPLDHDDKQRIKKMITIS